MEAHIPGGGAQKEAALFRSKGALFTLRWLHSSYWEEICYRHRHGVGGVSSLSLVHSYTGVQLLRLEGREKDSGGSRT